MERILLEICCGSADDCVEAERGGADRVELNSALFLGGLTPSLGTVRIAAQTCKIPIMAMIRPRAGGFCYTAREFESMEQDARALIEAGAAGIVFGCLTSEGTPDVERNARLTAIAHDMGAQAVFHRAIDVVPDWRAALDALIQLGVDRVLTLSLINIYRGTGMYLSSRMSSGRFIRCSVTQVVISFAPWQQVSSPSGVVIVVRVTA